MRAARSRPFLPLSAALLTGLLALCGPARAEEVPNHPDNIKRLHPGAHAPSAVLKTAEGKDLDLGQIIGHEPVVLVFFRGSWDPWDHTFLPELNEAVDPLGKLGYRLFAISADRPEKLREAIEQHKIRYTLLSDPQLVAARAFGVAWHLEQDEIERHGAVHADLEEASGEKHHQLPVPAVFIVNASGEVRYGYANPDHRVRIPLPRLLWTAERVLGEKRNAVAAGEDEGS